MPMIVDPSAPPVTPPEQVVSPEGWLTAVVDVPWAGVVLAVDYTAGDTPLDEAADVRKVLITRTNPDGTVVRVRSGDLAWAVAGVGVAYDHEAPLGAPVAYTATPLYADGTWGPPTSLAVEVPAPAAGELRDLWLKSVDTPGLSLRVMIASAGGRESAARQDTTDRAGSAYRAVTFDVHAAAAMAVTIDVPPEQLAQVRTLLDAGILLAQVRPGYAWPDAFFVPADISETPTGRLGSTGGYTVAFTIDPIERPDTVGQPMRMPGWSYDQLAADFATYDAVAASYPSYVSLATDGAI